MAASACGKRRATIATAAQELHALLGPGRRRRSSCICAGRTLACGGSVSVKRTAGELRAAGGERREPRRARTKSLVNGAREGERRRLPPENFCQILRGKKLRVWRRGPGNRNNTACSCRFCASALLAVASLLVFALPKRQVAAQSWTCLGLGREKELESHPNSGNRREPSGSKAILLL